MNEIAKREDRQLKRLYDRSRFQRLRDYNKDLFPALKARVSSKAPVESKNKSE
jgi:hypothetical protein